MTDDDFDTFESLDDESNEDEFRDESIVNERPAKTKRLDKRRQLEDLLEKKRLQSELDGYDEHLSQKGSYYDDDIFSD